MERAGGKEGNRGYDAAMVAVEMADLYARMRVEDAAAQPPTVVPAPATDLPRRK